MNKKRDRSSRIKMLNAQKFLLGRWCIALVLGLGGVLTGCGDGGGTDNLLCGGESCGEPIDDTPTDSTDGTLRIGNGSGASFVAGQLSADIGAFSLPQSGSTNISASVVDQAGALSTAQTTIAFGSTCASQGLAAFNQGTVTTSTGAATVTYTAQGCAGEDVITATTAAGLTASVTITVAPQVISVGSGSGTSYTPGALSLGIGAGATLSAGGQTTVTATVANQDGVLQTAPVSSPIQLAFTSGCVTQGLASFVGTTNGNIVSTTTGGATVVYKDDGCGVLPNGTADTITATALGFSGSVDLTIAPDVVNQIQFVSVEPSQLFLAGTGGEETAVVTFRVEGQLGSPVVGAQVNFALTTQIGGLSLPVSTATTNSDGEVSVTVQAGTVPTSVRVIATEASSGIATISDGLTVATGIADSDNFSVVASTINPECWTGSQGGTVQITAFMGDVFNNPPPDGTVVQFITEGGIVQSSCTTTGGTCSVTFTCTQEFVADGRIEVLGYTIGAESFDDLNTNGVFDAGDNFVPADNDLPEAFRDDNENGVFDDVVFLNYNPAVNSTHDLADGRYTGPNCDGSNTGTQCSQNTTLHVFNSVTLTQSDPFVTRILGSETVPAVTPSTTFSAFLGGTIFSQATGTLIDLTAGETRFLGNFVVGDGNRNSLPNGTTISITTTNGQLVGGGSFTVNNTTRPAVVPVTISADDTASADGSLTITVTVPGYSGFSFIWPVDDF